MLLGNYYRALHALEFRSSDLNWDFQCALGLRRNWASFPREERPLVHIDLLSGAVVSDSLDGDDIKCLSGCVFPRDKRVGAAIPADILGPCPIDRKLAG